MVIEITTYFRRLNEIYVILYVTSVTIMKFKVNWKGMIPLKEYHMKKKTEIYTN